MTRETHTATLSSTEAGGAAVVDRSALRYYPGWYHTVQAEVTDTATGDPAVAAGGTLSVRAKIRGAGTYQELGTINLAAPEPAIFEGYFIALEAVSTGFDADKTWTLYVSEGR